MPEAHQRYACEDDARAALLAAARELRDSGTPGSASLALRWPRSAAVGMLTIGAPIAAAATPDAVAWVPLDGRGDHADNANDADYAGAVLPPDWRLHRELLARRSRLSAVVRCRPVFCMTLACSPRLRETGIPAFHPDGPAAGAQGIRCALPAGPDVAALAERVDEALGERSACLLAGEGLVTVGSTLAAAVATVGTVETLAQVWWQLLQAEHRETHGVAA